ncbi:formate dehydrogenase accessory sulfurtransferase FdhD [Azospirillum sp. B510]|uniref:formate dehydrogenase accessory sulfurtransferase FdhD n=1 Tax=Azospirillum sp. (strain B510) TaxID=137722 RepID=UPI001FFE6EBF|nr:formate dehydrogenase accessory sulfurtransferase FdhD [Azospirillum sp. B510]
MLQLRRHGVSPWPDRSAGARAHPVFNRQGLGHIMDHATAGAATCAPLFPAPSLLARHGVRHVPATVCTATGMAGREEAVIDEVPVGLVYAGDLFAVMLATPTDLEDFATGFSLSEGIVGDAGELAVTAIDELADGVRIRMEVPVERLAALLRRKRNLMGGSGCGRCGTDSFAETLRPLDPVRSTARIAPDAIRRAMAALPSGQMLNRQTGAVHAAGFAWADGELVAVREDVGRHNALDKLIGALARAGIDPAGGFVVVSSRCSFEMVHKTAAAGIPLIAAISAPTSLCVGFAETVGVGVVAYVRDGRFTVYAVPSRVAAPV